MNFVQTRTRQIIQYRVTATLQQPEMEQHIGKWRGEGGGGTKPKGTYIISTKYEVM